jgi:hypothetical protein
MSPLPLKPLTKEFCPLFGTFDALFNPHKSKTQTALVDGLHLVDGIKIDEIGAVNAQKSVGF